MKTKKKNVIIFLIALLLPILLLCDFLLCLLLYNFESISYNEPDLSYSDFSFDLYKKFSYTNNSNFYIKQITENDVVSVANDKRLKYIDDTILVISEKNVSFDDMNTLFRSIDGEICGYIDVINFYQVTVSDTDYDELINICSVLEDSDLVIKSIVDYFEETPVAESSTETEKHSFDYYYFDLIGAYDAWTLSGTYTNEVNVGVLDVPVYTDCEYLDVINANDYSNEILNNNKILSSASHGTHVAGIIASAPESDAPGICHNANIYSDNAINNSISYWTASIVNMIVNENIKVINVSMGYNTYIPVSASLGCEFSLNYIENENEYFESFLKYLIENGFDFLICLAAGNETGTSLYKSDSEIFSYGEKDKLRKYDIFDIFSDSPEFCDAKYQLPMSAIESSVVRDHILIVGSCDYFMHYSAFSSSGNSVDIVAPGENIYSTSIDNTYEYMSGTSMATPFVTGSAALLFSIDASLTGPEVKQILINSAEATVSAYGYDYPLLNVGNAVQYVLDR